LQGAVYHVINRGNYRRDLFETDGAAAAFERCLDETALRHEWRVHAFVIMRNHFHLAVETPKPNLSVGMKYLQGTWVNRFNRYRGQTGRPFQDRFKARHIEPGHALSQVAHYIHLNPVRAKASTVETLASFRWSSLRWFLQPKRPPWLVAQTLLSETGSSMDTPAGWRRYMAYLEVMAEESPREREEKYGHMAKGWVIGTKEFRVSLIYQMRDAQ
jgi:REP element-mobilizing transposase RayT